jgi:hypothetical protein
MACIADELTREGLWEAFLARRVYGVTGDRIAMAFGVNGVLMGSRIQADARREVEVHVRGRDALDRIQILRNGRVIHTHCHQGTWDIPRAGQRSRYVLRVEPGWGPWASEIGAVGARMWSCNLALQNGGQFLRATPCWVTGGHEQAVVDGHTATFGLLVPQEGPGGGPSQFRNAYVLEFEARPEDVMALDIGGLQTQARVGELCAGSRVLWDEPEADALLRERYGLDPETLDRPGLARLYAHKLKMHRAIPEAGFSAHVSFIDDEPLAGEVNYRVRIEQRNGQRAWSSPVWVTPAG